MELEAEERWLRKLVMRLRTILRYATDSRAEAGLREAISDAESFGTIAGQPEKTLSAATADPAGKNDCAAAIAVE
jgi:hypothetical protein